MIWRQRIKTAAGIGLVAVAVASCIWGVIWGAQLLASVNGTTHFWLHMTVDAFRLSAVTVIMLAAVHALLTFRPLGWREAMKYLMIGTIIFILVDISDVTGSL